MKILVLSDVHSNKGIITKIVAKIKPDAIFFLGDGLSVALDELSDFKNADKVFMVRGNCDFFSKEPSVLYIELEDIKILLSHGHNFNVKMGMVELFEYAKSKNCDLVCFGHTHRIFNESINSIKFFNPGCLNAANDEENTFGVIEIEDEKISLKIEKI